MADKQRVLMVVPTELCNAGVPNVSMSIVRQLKDRYIFDFLTFSQKSGIYDNEIKAYGGQIFQCSLLDYATHQVTYPLRAYQIETQLRCILGSQNYIAVHSHVGVESGIIMHEAARFGVKKRITHAHGTYVRHGKNLILRAYLQFCKKEIKRWATVRLACSELSGKSLFLDQQFHNILNPVDIEYYENICHKYHESLNLLQIGYYCENKNQMFSLKLLNALLLQGIKCKLKLIGFAASEEYYKRMMEYIENHRLKQSVCFLPPDSDKRIVFEDADVLLLPSKSEGLPLVLLEAQSGGVVCLASKTVTNDANMGGVIYCSIDHMDEWIDIITSKKYRELVIESDRMKKLAINCYAERVGHEYADR